MIPPRFLRVFPVVPRLLVLCTALLVSLGFALPAQAYEAVDKIAWSDEHHRTDIALDAVQRSMG